MSDTNGRFDDGTVVTVELPDELAAEVDALIEAGEHPDRAAAVRAAVRRASGTGADEG
jgi:Arc/MetJ-type ribon-helix-helix transcriptional regulator